MKLLPLLCLVAACGSAPAQPDEPGSGEELLVWSADASNETLWLRDGQLVARARGIFVATPERAWQLMLVPRKVIDQHRCAGAAGRDAPPPTETSILVLVAVPLDNGEPRELAAQLEGDTTICGVPGSPPSIVGGVGARVSVVWSAGTTTSSGAGEESSVRAVIYDLSGDRAPLAIPDGFIAQRDTTLRLRTADDAAVCGAAPETWTHSGPDALRIELGEGSLHFAASAIADGPGATCDHLAWIDVDSTLGLGAIPEAAVTAAVAAWTHSAHFGVSWVPNDMKVRVQLERAFHL